MGYKFEYKNIWYWCLQPVIQIVIYVIIYEISTTYLKKAGELTMDVALGLTTTYLFYLFIALSILLLIFQWIKRKNVLGYTLVLILIFFLLSFNSLLGTPKLMLLIWIDVVISAIISYYIYVFVRKAMPLNRII